ncbi:MAG TPA: hypothetical protein VEZ14_11930 [Dehalococcoidia bacterium]|nr:hypothetical protein [Dehalococcoidia bacterium]
MEFSHDANCDGKHPPRQRCNDALAAGAERRFELPWRAAANGAASHGDVSALREEPAVDAPREVVAAAEPTVDPQRDAIAAVEPAPPSAYTAQAWQSTVAALEEPDHAASDRGHAVEAVAKRAPPRFARAGLLVATGVVALLLWSLARPRRAEAPERG